MGEQVECPPRVRPTRRDKINAKKRKWQTRFLRHLREQGNITTAAALTGITRKTAYDARWTDPAFEREWEEAEDQAVELMEAEARRRAVHGTPRPVFHNGQQVGETIEYSDVLLIFLLKAHRPEKYRERHEVTVIDAQAGLARLLGLTIEQLAHAGVIEVTATQGGEAVAGADAPQDVDG